MNRLFTIIFEVLGLAETKEEKADAERNKPHDKRTVAEARAYVKERRKQLEKSQAKLSKEAKEKLEAALASAEAAVDLAEKDESGAARAEKRMPSALKELDARFEKELGVEEKSTAREYTESILIAVLIAVVLRAFVVEAFKIPTGSMIPTLAVGDHIFVNKFIYGLRIPLTNAWFAEWGTPKHGDVIVFRYPKDMSKDYIKRVVAVAGDRVRADLDGEVFVNGHRMERSPLPIQTYEEEGPEGSEMPSFPVHVRPAVETSLGDSPHHYTVYYAPKNPERLTMPSRRHDSLPGLACAEDRPEAPGECTVEPGYVFVMGDNRDNSSDSREWGGVPTANVKGRAMFIWWSWSAKPGASVRWDRLGKLVE